MIDFIDIIFHDIDGVFMTLQLAYYVYVYMSVFVCVCIYICSGNFYPDELLDFDLLNNYILFEMLIIVQISCQILLVLPCSHVDISRLSLLGLLKNQKTDKSN